MSDFLLLMRLEMRKTFRKPRTIVGIVAILVVIPLVVWGLAAGGETIEKEFARGLEEQFIVLGTIMNGYTATVLVLNFLWIHVPLLVTLVAGDTLAGEAAAGTLRLTLTRRQSRSRILAAKWMVSMGYAVGLVFLMGLLAIGLGVLFMGSGDLLVLTEAGISLLGEDQALGQLLAAVACGALSMMTVASLAFLFGVLSENSLTPVIGAMAVIVVSLAVSGLPVTSFDALRPWLFTSHFDIWTLALESPVPGDLLAQSAAIHAGYIALFTGLSFWIFNHKDIRS
ncbi:MAG: ABC transporter permease [Calditrichaeota bacterium]|nr:ABC transporter permease [Candidatus Cloacimonadota bacterium]MCB1048138.1 ABC transporter permease [Calditrichota bacterium]MCB9473681.1 ABC transporter permease [Candidatus Delongbacteria bacterium]